MFVGSLAGATYLRYTVLMSPNKDETAVHCCDPALSVLVMFGVSKRLTRSISLAVYCNRTPSFLVKMFENFKAVYFDVKDAYKIYEPCMETIEEMEQL